VTMERIESRLLKETIHRATLDSGLEVFVLPKKGFNKKYATYTTRYGSVDTHFVDPATGKDVSFPDGIAHFLEHKMFEHEGGSVFDKFSKLGASANAYTDYTSTTYLFSTTENFDQSLRTLLASLDERDPPTLLMPKSFSDSPNTILP